MTFELLISTMHKNVVQVLDMIKMSNISCDVLVVVQGNINDYREVTKGNQNIKIFFSKERGLSKSRNMALRNSKADIVLLADDDLYYYDGFDEIILDAFQKNDQFEFIIFNVDNYEKSYPREEKRFFFLNVLGVSSWQIAFKRGDVVNKNIFFNENFGTGSGMYMSGEENIFLAKCYSYFKMIYLPTKILKRNESKSTWFTGYDDKFLFDRGAVFYAISPKISYFLIFQFVVRRKHLFPNYTYFRMLNNMFSGLKHCRDKNHHMG
ncbi:glycosyltransferase family A protein [Acinetobacter sp. YH12131]|uniref:glycosyltransferase family A protein n=1 Tax=Acinetobacter sp. YH12131 TaxID=2601115 RepID=UPI0015D1CCEE|nr:glycosyltransferase family A protein [Acinetobacter sp. YH12131]